MALNRFYLPLRLERQCHRRSCCRPGTAPDSSDVYATRKFHLVGSIYRHDSGYANGFHSYDDLAGAFLGYPGLATIKQGLRRRWNNRIDLAGRKLVLRIRRRFTLA